MKSKASEFESDFNVSKALEKQFKRVVDDLVLLCDLTLESWRPDALEKQFKRVVDDLVLCDLPLECWRPDEEEQPKIQSRDEQSITESSKDEEMTCTDRDGISCRTGSFSTAYSGYYNDDATFFTHDDETLYSRYSEYTGYSEYTRESEHSRNINATEKDETGAVQLSEEETRLLAALRRHAASLGISEDELLRELEKEQKKNQKEKKTGESVVKQKSQLEPVVEETNETASSQGSCRSVVDDPPEQCLHLDWNEADEQVQYQSIEQVLSKRGRRAIVKHCLGFTSKKKAKSTRRKRARSRKLFGMI
jgi:hypothetical protein